MKIISTLILLLFLIPATQAQFVKKSTDIICLVPSATAAVNTIARHDRKGLLQLALSSATCVAVNYGLEAAITKERPDGSFQRRNFLDNAIRLAMGRAGIRLGHIRRVGTHILRPTRHLGRTRRRGVGSGYGIDFHTTIQNTKRRNLHIAHLWQRQIRDFGGNEVKIIVSFYSTSSCCKS